MTVLKALMQSPQVLALVINFSLTFAVHLMGEDQVYECFVWELFIHLKINRLDVREEEPPAPYPSATDIPFLR